MNGGTPVNINSILKTDGTNQDQRLLSPLDTDNIKIDERSLKDLLNYIYQISKQVNFYDLTNQIDGDWGTFFNEFVNPDPTIDSIIYSDESLAKLIDSRRDFDPYFSLVLTFLKLFGHVQNDINKITGRHLEYFYKEVLRLSPKKAKPDTAHVVFEAAKNTSSFFLPSGTLLNAGKDESGNPLLYKTSAEIVVSHALVSGLKSVFVDQINNKSRIYQAPVANSADGMGKPLDEGASKWSAFGESQQEKIEGSFTMEDASTGFAIASPLFVLKEGERIISLNLYFDPLEHEVVNQQLNKSLLAYISGEEDWISIPVTSAILQRESLNPRQGRLEITLHIPVDYPATAAYRDDLFQEGYSTPWPILKLHLNPDAYAYDNLRVFSLSKVKIHVNVTGVKDLILANDLGPIDASKPFMPFGPQPAIGGNFYIGSEEVFQKRLQSFSMNLTWGEVPPFLWDHYKAYYDSTTVNFNTIFRARLKMLLKKSWNAELVNPIILFNSESADKPRKYDITETHINATTVNLNYTRNPYFQSGRYDHTTQQGYIKLELSEPLVPFKAFGHKEFPGIYSEKAIALSRHDPASSLPEPELPNPPYTPLISDFSLDYTSQEEIPVSNQQIEQFFSIGPFGHQRIQPEGHKFLLPQFESEGNFYIGLQNLILPQQVNLLFQIAEGSAEGEDIPTLGSLSWSYLSGDQWVKFDSMKIQLDTTQNLQRSGIISFILGRDLTLTHTAMPTGLGWIRASVVQDASGMSKLIAVMTNAISVDFVLEDVDEIVEKYAAHLNKGLAPFKINSLVKKEASIKSVVQPFSSSGGRGNEDTRTFNIWAGERLRHKNRVVTLWDYERKVLEAFPSIYKVKCLNHTNVSGNISPGYLTLIVVSNLRNKNAVNPLEPKTSTSTMADIQEFLQACSSPFIQLPGRIKVENPAYERLLVDVQIGYHPGRDPGYYGNLLNEEIKKFLSPWAYSEGEDITFGGRIYKSDILAFIESREYVDFVKEFDLYHIHDGLNSLQKGIGNMQIGRDFIIKKLKTPGVASFSIGTNFVIGNDVEVAIATSSKSILISDINHRISEADTGICEGIKELGIGYLTVGIDMLIDESV